MTKVCKLATSLATLVGCTVGLLFWMRVDGNGPPLGSHRIIAPPTTAINDPAHTVWLGQGCFWHTQYDFVQIEQDAAGPFGGRSDEQVTALVGYAGGRFAGPGGAVCYHGNPSTDYSLLGHSEAVAVELDATNATLRVAQFTALLEHFYGDGFVGEENARQDPQDQGAQYRSVVGLPGGSSGTEGEDGGAMHAALRTAAAKRGMPLLQGRGGLAGDTIDEGVVYVYDSDAFPFFRGEELHQFHRNSVLRRAVPHSYTNVLKDKQAALGRLGNPGCAGGEAASALGMLLLPAFVLGLLVSAVCFGQAVCAQCDARGKQTASAQGIELQLGAGRAAGVGASALAAKPAAAAV